MANPNGFAVTQLQQMNRLIRHRGPDDEGYFLFYGKTAGYESLGGDDTPQFQAGSERVPYLPLRKFSPKAAKALVGFGHRRLSIVDLSASGHQPMSYSNNRYWITYNGEVYNHTRLRDRLNADGSDFVSKSDTEVILAAYHRWGPACLHSMIGMWSFAIFDEVRQSLFFARDRYGIKPFYYWFSPDGSLCFGSEIKQFEGVTGWAPTGNAHEVSKYLYFNGLTDDSHQTMFSGVHSLEPGHCATISLRVDAFPTIGPIKTTKWYQPERIEFEGDFSKAADGFRSLFFESISDHLQADVKVGCALSGGLDSSSVVCVADRVLSRTTNDPLNTFSSVCDDEAYSERKWIDLVISEVNVTPHFVAPTVNGMVDTTSFLIRTMDEPYQSQSAYLGHEVYRCASQNGIPVVLNGQGADEYLSGYGGYRDMRLRQSSLLGLVREFSSERGITHANLISLGKWIALDSARRLPPSCYMRIRRFTPKYRNLAKLVDSSRIPFPERLPYERPFKSHLDISNYQLSVDALPRYLRWEDRNSMSHSIEARVPFLDHRLVEFAHSLPLSFHDERNRPKRLLSQAMSGILPESVRLRPDKKGFLTPEQMWVTHDRGKNIRKLLETSIECSQGILKPGALAYFDNVASGREPFDFTYWRLISLGLWMNAFRIHRVTQ
jgi:asparagine synthase (glutamine-hydrolysing)